MAKGAGIYNAGALTLHDSTLSGNGVNMSVGFAVLDGGGIYNAGTLTVSNSLLASNGTGPLRSTHFWSNGAGIFNAGGTLSISDSTLSGNTAAGGLGYGIGDGIDNAGGSVTISNSALTDNAAEERDGAIGNAGTLTLTYSTIANNSALAFGPGGIGNGGMLAISNCTFTGNKAMSDDGGGINNGGTLVVNNSTFTRNSAGGGAGGGIMNHAMLTATNCTFAGNIALDGGGVYNFAGGTLAARNTIFAGNTSLVGSDPDLGGLFTSLGHNLIGNTSGASGFVPSDLLNVAPLLGPLQDNGGPTQTMGLLPGSPAVDAGDNTDASDFDQRGPSFPRIVGDVIDIGAFEVQPGPASRLQVTAPAQVTANTAFDVTVTALDVYGHRAVGYLGTVTFTSTDPAPGITLPTDYPFTATDNGVHVFASAVTLRTVGGQTITVTDTLTPSIGGSTAVLVSPPLFLVTTTLDSGPGSFRQAIIDADATPSPDIIRFAIGTGIQTIDLTSPLPAITQPMVIDGMSQPGYTGSPLIELDGAGAGSGADGLLIAAGGSVVRGLVINRFSLYGIELRSNGGNVIQGNYIGTDVTGTIALGNGMGVGITSSNNMIGGTAAGAGNVISGNLGDGVFIADGSSGNWVQGNSIGTDASGTVNLGNANNGVRLLDAFGNTVGGTTDGAGNRIAFNSNDGVLVMPASETASAAILSTPTVLALALNWSTEATTRCPSPF
jgi:hypothetical protein